MFTATFVLFLHIPELHQQSSSAPLACISICNGTPISHVLNWGEGFQRVEKKFSQRSRMFQFLLDSEKLTKGWLVFIYFISLFAWRCGTTGCIALGDVCMIDRKLERIMDQFNLFDIYTRILRLNLAALCRPAESRAGIESVQFSKLESNPSLVFILCRFYRRSTFPNMGL